MDSAPEPLDGEWWQEAVAYLIYPRSFDDSDGDGVGARQRDDGGHERDAERACFARRWSGRRW